jgi:hypothetical protein
MARRDARRGAPSQLLHRRLADVYGGSPARGWLFYGLALLIHDCESASLAAESPLPFSGRP